MTASTITKISKSEAMEVAHQLLQNLDNSGNLKDYLKDLCSSYSGGARAEILSQAAPLIKRRKIAIADDVLVELVRENMHGQKAKGLENLLKAMIEVGANTKLPQGPALVLAAAITELSLTNNPDTYSDPLNRLGEDLRSTTTPVAESMMHLASWHSKQEAFTLWAEMALPSMGSLKTPASFSQQDCDTILSGVAKLSPELVPRSIEARLPLLLGRAGESGTSTFMASDVGKKFDQNFGVRLQGSAQGAAKEEEKPPPIPKKQLAALKAIEDIFHDLNVAKDALVREQRKELADHRAECRREISASEEIARRLRQEREALRRECAALRESNSEIENELKASKEELGRFESEVRQLNLELEKRQADQSEQLIGELRNRLLKPAGNLRDSIERLADDSDVHVDIRPIAAAFDQVHRKLLRLAKVENERRISEKILKGE